MSAAPSANPAPTAATPGKIKPSTPATTAKAAIGQSRESAARVGLPISGSAVAVRLEDALWWRVERLPARERELLEVIAVSRGPVTQQTAAAALATLDVLDDPQLLAELR